MGKFCQILTELSARDKPIFSFPDDNLSKCQGILTKFGTCTDMKTSGLGLLMGKFRQFLTGLSARDTVMAGYYSLTFLFNVFSTSCTDVITTSCDYIPISIFSISK